MADQNELETRQQHRLEQIRLQAQLHDQRHIRADEFDVEVERLRGDNERSLTRLTHELDIENRQLDLQYNEFKNSQQLRLEALQIAVKQQDDMFRHFWALDAEVLGLETRLIEKKADAVIAEQFSAQTHRQSMEAKTSDQYHDRTMSEEERMTLSHKNELDKDNFEFKERLKITLMREFGNVAEAKINATLEKLAREGKI
ncbi:hypothetical protein [Halocynthiibacter sp.]|uniref:hypothetical protein n=1 Tax=Halocynthiibacter sp. TaxID=1979210 RepID=UPI003C662124